MTVLCIAARKLTRLSCTFQDKGGSCSGYQHMDSPATVRPSFVERKSGSRIGLNSVLELTNVRRIAGWRGRRKGQRCREYVSRRSSRPICLQQWVLNCVRLVVS